MKRFILSAIRFYQHSLNLTNPVMRQFFLTGSACRFTPTCSQYIYEAISTRGIISGLKIGVRRILRCHPFAKGGYDPVPLS